MKKKLFTSLTIFIAALAVIMMNDRITVFAGNTVEITKDGFEYYIDSDDNGNEYVSILAYGGNAKEVTVPSELEGIPVTKIGTRAFRDSPDIVKLVLPESIETLGEECFANLSKLEEITLGGVRKFADRFGNESDTVREHLFFSCKQLKRVVFGDGCHFLEEYNSSTAEINMFSNEVLNHLEYIYIGSQMPQLPERLFCGTSLKKVEISPENKYYQSIDSALFDKSGQSLLIVPTSYERDTFVIPYGTTTIAGFGMDGCRGLKKIYIPQTMQGLSRGFSGISAVLYVVQGSVGERFAKEQGFRYQYYGVYLDKTVLSLLPGKSEALQAVNETENTLSFRSSDPAIAAVDQNGVIMAQNIGTAEITVSDGKEFSVKCIVTVAEKSQTTESDQEKEDTGNLDHGSQPDPAENPIQGAESLDKKYDYKVSNVKEAVITGFKNKNISAAVIPEKVILGGKQYEVTEIADRAFYKNKKLKSIVLPSSIKKIGRQAFYGCKKLKKITIKTTKLTKKNVGAKAFKKIHEKAVIKAPKRKLKAYKKICRSRGAGNKVKYEK